jgi:hypothetical protein
MIEVTRRQGRRRKKLLDDLKDRRGYCHLKEEALDRNMWRDRFGRGFEPVVRQTTGWWWWRWMTLQVPELCQGSRSSNFGRDTENSEFFAQHLHSCWRIPGPALFWDVSSLDQYLFTDISGQHIGPLFKGRVQFFLGCSDTSVNNYQSTLRNIPEECRSHAAPEALNRANSEITPKVMPPPFLPHCYHWLPYTSMLPNW